MLVTKGNPQQNEGRDPSIQTPSEFQFYVQEPGAADKREFDRGSLQGMRKSLGKAHDNLTKQVGINTRLYAQLTRTERRLDRANLKIWLLLLLLGGEGGVIGWLAKFVFDHLAVVERLK